MAKQRSNILSLLAFLLAAASFINSLLPNSPIAIGAPNQQAATDAAIVQAAQSAQPIVAAQADQPSITLQGAAVASTVPSLIGYQGVLRDSEGKPITGQVNVTFRIYDALTGNFTQCRPELSPCKWEEKHSNITVRDGRFSVLLGNASNPITPTLMTSPDRFVGVQVDGYQEMQPRQRFSSVPFAMWSERAAHANTLSAPDGNLLDAVYVNNAGNVGIGTTNPTQKLQVIGNTYVGGDIGVGANLSVGGNAIVNGSLGIGTANPERRLHVAGDVRVDGWLFLNGSDFMMAGPGRGDAGRAIVHGGGDALILNFANDFAGGTHVNSSLDVSGEIRGKLRYTGTYRWEQGQGPIQMIHASQGFCFLTYVRGKFEGGGESVSVFIGGDDFWYLIGTSGQSGVAVEARCAG